MAQGRIKFVSTGWGFLTPSDKNTQELFWHISAFADESIGLEDIAAGMLVEYEIVPSKKGNKLCAAKIRIVPSSGPQIAPVPDNDWVIVPSRSAHAVAPAQPTHAAASILAEPIAPKKTKATDLSQLEPTQATE